MTTWYHGSKRLVSVLRKQRATTTLGRPQGEALEAIYFTPNFAFALACAVRPAGITEMDLDRGTIRFGDPAAFDPEQLVYIYSVDSAKIPDEHKIRVDDLQMAVTLDEIEPDDVEVHRSGEIVDYLRILE